MGNALYEKPKKFVCVGRDQVLASHIHILREATHPVCAEERTREAAMAALEKTAKEYGANGMTEVHVEERWVRGRLYEAWGKPAVLGVLVSAGETAQTMTHDFVEPAQAAPTTYEKNAKSRKTFEIYLLIAVIVFAVYILNKTFGNPLGTIF